MRMARSLHEETQAKNLVLAGGVALNCVANGRLRREGPFDSIWVKPAAGDAGGALGAAMFVWHQLLEKSQRTCPNDAMKGSLLGPRHSTGEIEAFLRRAGAIYRRISNESELVAYTAKAFGGRKGRRMVSRPNGVRPRALRVPKYSRRSRSARMQATMNVRIRSARASARSRRACFGSMRTSGSRPVKPRTRRNADGRACNELPSNIPFS